MTRVDRTEEIRTALARAGYDLIQFDVEANGRIEADVVAWAADASGQLVPWVVVEVKEWGKGQKTRPELGLRPLTRARSSLGSREHYVVANGDWYKADPGLRKLERVFGPTPPPHGARGEVQDVSRAVELYQDIIRRQLLQRRLQPGAIGDYFWPQEPYDLDLALETESGQSLTASPEVLWEARRRALVEHAVSSGPSRHVSHTVIAKAVAALAASRLTSDVFDPFCGTGSFLWEAIGVAHDRGSHLQSVLGWDIDQQSVSLARSIAAVAPVPAEIVAVEAFQPHAGDPSRSVPLSTVVVSAPPISLNLANPYELADGSSTKDGEAAAVDLAVRALAVDGRAVLHVGRGFTQRRSTESLRAFLAHNYRVGAVIGLPGGAAPGTQAGTVLLVVDNTRPTSTFVAQLGNDWQVQLGLDGAALRAALSHLDGLTGAEPRR